MKHKLSAYTLIRVYSTLTAKVRIKMHAVSLCFIQVACFNHFIAVFTDTEKNSYTCIMLATDYSREARVLFLRVIGKV